MSLRFPTRIVLPLVILFLNYSAVALSYDQAHLKEEETAVLNDLKIIFGREAGVSSYKKSDVDLSTKEDATLTVMDIRRNWDSWSPEFRKAAGADFLVKPYEAGTVSLPRYAAMSAKKSTRSGHILPNWVETANFSIEWGNNLKDEGSGIVSDNIVNCSMKSAGKSCPDVPDIVAKWADYFEHVWATEIKGLGYKEPTGTGSFLYDIYIANTQDNKIGNDDDQTPSMGYNFLGLTTTYCDAHNICKSDLPDSYSYILVNNYINDSDTMKITAAHEFFHAIQFSYPSINRWFSAGNHWWLESTATWMEEVVYSEVNEYYPRVRSWLRVPWVSLKDSGSKYSNHEYGDVLFVLFMTDVYLNGDNNFIKYVWESGTDGLNDGFDAMDTVLANFYKKGNFASAFKEFVSLNALTASNYTDKGYKEGVEFGSVAVSKIHNKYPVSFSEVSGENAPHELGSNYIHFLPEDNKDNQLTIEFNGSAGNNWSAMVVKIRGDGSGYEHDEVLLNPESKYGCYTISGFGSTFSEVFLIPVILIDPDYNGTSSYYYKASLNSVCKATPDAYLTTSASSDAQVYSAVKTNNDKRCFIATAAFGSPDSPFVKILRDFRDEYLIPYDVGRRFVRTYYNVSPAIAVFLEQHPPAPFIMRVILFPAIGAAFILLTTTLLEKIILFAIILFLFTGTLRFFLDKH